MIRQIKNSKTLSILAVCGFYLLAGIAGIALYRNLSCDARIRLLSADAAATAIVFLFSVLMDNASVYDPYWSVFPPVALTLLCVGKSLTAINALQLAVVWLWGVRLTGNWACSFRGLCDQDWRYTMLRSKTGRLYPFVNFFGIHLVPTLIVFLCVLPAAFAVQRQLRGNALSFLSLAVSLCGVFLQAAADHQMHVFRKANRGRLIRTGLWTYSRHPNYLGEILMWWGVGLSVFCAAPDQLWLLSGAAVNTALFLFVSIPMADERQSRKPGYDAYKRRTRMLLPIRRS